MSTSPTTDRILVPLDGTWIGMTAIPWLRGLATDATEVVLVRAISLTLPITGFAAMPAETYDVLQRQAFEGANAYLDAVAEELADLTTQVTKIARLGAPADEILAATETHQPTLILMATEGRGAAGRIIAGSVADRVARVSPVPVMLVPARAEPAPYPGDPAPCGRIVVPFDGSDLARSALPVAAALARRIDVPVHLLRVVPGSEEMVGRQDIRQTGRLFQRAAQAMPVLGQPSVDPAWHEGYVGSIREALASEASRLAATGVQADSEARVGETVPQLLDALAPDDVVVMTSHGEGGVRRWLMGSVAEQLIHQAVAPVVLVPSPGRERITG